MEKPMPKQFTSEKLISRGSGKWDAFVHIHRAGFLKSMDFDDQDLSRPFVAVANSWNELVPGHYYLRRLSRAVKAGIWQAGGMPLEFNHIAACDGLADGNEGFYWILPSRDIIAASIEMMIQSSRLDGIVALSTCDKIVPAQLMALARINIPSIMVNGGYMLPGYYQGREINSGEIIAHYSEWKEGRFPNDDFEKIVDSCCPTGGACGMMGTANTMCCLAEALGMSLPGNATMAAVDSSLYRLGKAAGRQIMDLIARDIRPHQIMSSSAIENSLMVHSAIGGSTNALLHMPAICHELGISLPLSKWNEVTKKAPHLVNVTSGSSNTMKDFSRAGGIQALMVELASILSLSVMTCTGKTLSDNLKGVSNYNNEIIRPLTNPVYPEGSVSILYGNLCPNGAVVKQTAVPNNMLRHRGPAKVFEDEESAKGALSQGAIAAGDVVVIRNEGPKGGPGMREMYTFQASICAMGLDHAVALVTDGRFSGFTKGPAIGHVCPEAADKGPISILEDGDIISYDICKRQLVVELLEKDIQTRLRAWVPKNAKITNGFLGSVYRHIVSSADKGCVLGIKG
jgi:dihydroxy-acid dehydratase